MKARRLILALGLAVSGTGLALDACSSSGGVANGGACYTATDCANGLYCFGVTTTAAGVCTNNANKAQPAADGSYPDGGLAPMLDAPSMPPTDSTVTPTDTGTAPTDTGTAPVDTGTAPVDTGTPPMDTGTAGS